MAKNKSKNKNKNKKKTTAAESQTTVGNLAEEQVETTVTEDKKIDTIEVSAEKEEDETNKQETVEIKKSKTYSRKAVFVVFAATAMVAFYLGMVFGSITDIEKIPFGKGVANYMKPLMNKKANEQATASKKDSKKAVDNLTVYNDIPSDKTTSDSSLADSAENNSALKDKLEKRKANNKVEISPVLNTESGEVQSKNNTKTSSVDKPVNTQSVLSANDTAVVIPVENNSNITENDIVEKSDLQVKNNTKANSVDKPENTQNTLPISETAEVTPMEDNSANTDPDNVKKSVVEMVDGSQPETLPETTHDVIVVQGSGGDEYKAEEVEYFSKRLGRVCVHILTSKHWEKNKKEREAILGFQNQLKGDITLQDLKAMATHVLPMVIKMDESGDYKTVRTFPERTEGLGLLSESYAEYMATNDSRVGEVTLLYTTFLVSHDEAIMKKLLERIKEVCK